MLKVVTQSPAETKKLAAALAKQISAGTVIALLGGLGSGKTTFVKGFARGLGIKQKIISPTFVLVKPYPLAEQRIFYHFDLYRLRDHRELLELGWSEIVRQANHVVAIEWAEKVRELLPKNTLKINFRSGKTQNQKILRLWSKK